MFKWFDPNPIKLQEEKPKDFIFKYPMESKYMDSLGVVWEMLIIDGKVVWLRLYSAFCEFDFRIRCKEKLQHFKNKRDELQRKII